MSELARFAHHTRASLHNDRAVAKKFREVRRILRDAGWRFVRTAGSHEIWEGPDGVTTVTVPGGGKANRDVPVGTLSSIRRVTGLKELR